MSFQRHVSASLSHLPKLLLSSFVLDSWWRCNGSVNEAWRGESWTMPKGGGAKTPQLDHFPLNTDMVEKQGGKKVR